MFYVDLDVRSRIPMEKKALMDKRQEALLLQTDRANAASIL